MEKGGLEVTGTRYRAALASIWRFNRLANVEKPTGSAEIPCLVKRTQEIEDAIDRAEVIGYVKMHKTNSDSDAEDDNNDGCPSRNKFC